jgi:hypothetical protein
MPIAGLGDRQITEAGQARERNPMLGNMGSPSCLVVVLEAEVGNQGLALYVAERVLQFHQLNEEIVFRIQPGSGHG